MLRCWHREDRESRHGVLGFDFMYVGLLLMYFNLSMFVVSAFAIIMLHLQILQEERYLTENYGESYRVYRKHVFRYLGRRIRSREKKEAEKELSGI